MSTYYVEIEVTRVEKMEIKVEANSEAEADEKAIAKAKTTTLTGNAHISPATYEVMWTEKEESE